MLAAPGLAQVQAARKTRVYLLERYYFKAGAQLSRFHDYISHAGLAALDKVHKGPKIILEAFIASHTPQVAVVLGFPSISEFWTMRARLNEDEDLAKAYEAWQSGSEPPFESQTNALLEAADYSPEVVALEPPPKTPRVFELRVYRAPGQRQLKALHERFGGPQLKIFQRAGVNPVLYGSTVIGPDMPNLTYLIPFDDMAARDKAWTAFSADPEWIKLRQESTDKNGQVTVFNQIELFRATAYSPIR
jgi:hypothetical protein